MNDVNKIVINNPIFANSSLNLMDYLMVGKSYDVQKGIEGGNNSSTYNKLFFKPFSFLETYMGPKRISSISDKILLDLTGKTLLDTEKKGSKGKSIFTGMGGPLPQGFGSLGKNKSGLEISNGEIPLSTYFIMEREIGVFNRLIMETNLFINTLPEDLKKSLLNMFILHKKSLMSSGGMGGDPKTFQAFSELKEVVVEKIKGFILQGNQKEYIERAINLGAPVDMKDFSEFVTSFYSLLSEMNVLNTVIDFNMFKDNLLNLSNQRSSLYQLNISDLEKQDLSSLKRNEFIEDSIYNKLARMYSNYKIELDVLTGISQNLLIEFKKLIKSSEGLDNFGKAMLTERMNRTEDLQNKYGNGLDLSFA